MKMLIIVAMALGAGVILGETINVLLPAPPRPLAEITTLQSMVREAATFGWRCREHGDSEETCTVAVLRVIGGTP